MKYQVLELFAGIGGFSLGLERTGGFETVAFCEIDKFCQKVLNKHYPEVPIYEDVRGLTAGELKSDGINPNVITGGFACQPHSFSGSRLASADSRDVWPDYARLIGEIRPQYAIAENVLGLLSSEDGQYFGGVLRDLACIGYNAEWFCLHAGAVGAAHLRPRVWLVAYPNETQFKGRGISERVQQEYTNAGYTRRGQDKSGVERMAYDVSSQVDRVGALGNAVVPEIPYLIGRAILESSR